MRENISKLIFSAKKYERSRNTLVRVMCFCIFFFFFLLSLPVMKNKYIK